MELCIDSSEVPLQSRIALHIACQECCPRSNVTATTTRTLPALAQSVLLLQKGLSSVCLWFAFDELSSSVDTLSEFNCSPRWIVLLLGSAFVCKALLLAQYAHQRMTESAVRNCVELVTTSSWPLHQGNLTAYCI